MRHFFSGNYRSNFVAKLECNVSKEKKTETEKGQQIAFCGVRRSLFTASDDEVKSCH